jgi:hypothetical protein
VIKAKIMYVNPIVTCPCCKQKYEYEITEMKYLWHSVVKCRNVVCKGKISLDAIKNSLDKQIDEACLSLLCEVSNYYGLNIGKLTQTQVGIIVKYYNLASYSGSIGYTEMCIYLPNDVTFTEQHHIKNMFKRNVQYMVAHTMLTSFTSCCEALDISLSAELMTLLACYFGRTAIARTLCQGFKCNYDAEIKWFTDIFSKWRLMEQDDK